MVSYHLPCHWDAYPRPLRGDPTRNQWTAWSRGGNSSFQKVGTRVSDAQRNPLRCRNQLSSTTLRTDFGFRPASGGRTEESDHLPETASNWLLGWDHVSLVQGVGWKVLCCVRVYKRVSLRRSLVAKWVRSPDPRFCGELIRSRVSPNRASGVGLYGLTGAKESPKSPWGEWQETQKRVLFPKSSPSVSV
jgi:hypothetical protein